MISHKHKFIFIHIIKTGGESVEKSFRGRKIHKFAKNYKKKINGKDWDNYFKFAFVRNPWDKMVSQYFYIQKNTNGLYEQSFEEFITAFKDCSENEYIERKGIKVKFNPIQLPWISDDDGNIMMDFIGRFENLQEVFNTVCYKIKIPHRKLPHENETNHEHYSEYYNDETKGIVAKKFEKDIEHFGYKFEK
jgi:hypothetical protein